MTFSPETEAKVAEIIARYPEQFKKSALVPLLIYIQDETRAITPDVVSELARRLEIREVQVDEVIGYYSMLHRKPMGKYHLQICTNISCMLRGADDVWEHACKKLGIGHKQVTPDGLFSLEEAECIAACSWAPAIQVGYDFEHHVSIERFDQLLDNLRKANQNAV